MNTYQQWHKEGKIPTVDKTLGDQYLSMRKENRDFPGKYDSPERLLWQNR